jgi:hypothetical protein
MDEREPSGRHRRPGEIHPGVAYRKDEAKDRMGWGESALRAARRRGLVVCREGKRVFILGDDLIAYLKRRRSVSKE